MDSNIRTYMHALIAIKKNNRADYVIATWKVMSMKY